MQRARIGRNLEVGKIKKQNKGVAEQGAGFVHACHNNEDPA
jgi:hypothetical protein